MAGLFVFPRVFEAEMALTSDVIFLARPATAAEIPPNTFPTAIRWRIHQDLGFPREPFKVFRRSIGFSAKTITLTATPITIFGSAIIEWGRIPLMELRLTAFPSAGASLMFQALDDRGDPIVGVTAFVDGSISVPLRTPNMCALQVIGNGSISPAAGVSMADLANDPNWELIETVGLPVTSGQVPDNVYYTGLQGRPGALKLGLDAAKDRLDIGVQLYVPPPATDPSGGPAPSWPAPPPDQVLSEVRDGDTSALSLILDMLGKVDPESIDFTQAAFEREIKGTGLRQPGGTPSTEPSSSKLKLASVALLSAAVDTWTALALGFGTTDFPAQVTPGFDYMITAPYTMPFGFKLTLAAVAVPSGFAVQQPVAFAAQTARRHRPLKADLAAGADVALSWRRLPRNFHPQGYAIGIREGSGAPTVLNQP